MPVRSAGLLLYRVTDAAPEVFIAHMGGPFWASKDEAAWSVPKGEYDPDDESALEAALREFREELGVAPPPGPYAELGTWTYSSGKRIAVFVADGAGYEPGDFAFGEFDLEWPPRSGRTASFPEVDRVEWMPLPDARARLVKGQRPALDALEQRLGEAGA